jgi:hypothetical protein
MFMDNISGGSHSNVASVADTFPISALPPIMRSIAQETADLLSVPVALPACAALATSSAALGQGLAIKSNIGQLSFGNLFIVAAATSGAGKSASFREILFPIFEYQTFLRIQARQECRALRAELFELNKKLNDVRTGKVVLGDEELPSLLDQKQTITKVLTQKGPAIVCEDITPQAMLVLLGRNREVIFSASPDAKNCIQVLSRDRQDSPYIKAWSGDPVEVTRVTREAVSLCGPRMTLLWLPQTDVVREMFTRRVLTRNGFLPRVLPCVLESLQKQSSYEMREISQITKDAWNDLIIGLLKKYHASHGKPHVLKQSDKLRNALIEYSNSIVNRMEHDLVNVREFAHRWAEQAWRLTVVLHAAKHGTNAEAEVVQSSTGKEAISLMEFFGNQQLELLRMDLDCARIDQECKVMQKLMGEREMTARDFVHSRVCADRVEAKSLLDKMHADGRLAIREHRPERGGVPTRYYRRNDVTNATLVTNGASVSSVARTNQ